MNIVKEGGRSVRLKGSKRVVEELKGYLLAHMKRYRFQARYDISGSSFRVNLGAGFAPLLFGEAGKIKVFFKVLEGCFEMFYKEDEEAMYPPQIRRADYGRGLYFCSSYGTGYYDADKCPVCGTKTRKEGRKRNNGEKPRVNIEGG